MSLDTSNINSGSTAKEKIAILRKKHQPYFEKMGIPDAIFIPKMIYGDPLIFIVWPSEFRLKQDIYFEKTGKNFESEDSERNLYVLKFKETFDTDYYKVPHGTDFKYVIPFNQAEKIFSIDEEEFSLGIPDPNEDAPFSELMIRDIAAILWKKPVSQKAWLNNLINKNK